MDRLKITYQSPAALRPRANNPRTHSKKQIRQIADSIREFGFTNPVLIDAGRDAYTELKNPCIWAKTNGGMGSPPSARCWIG